eukprot:176959-Chlamydomonas_euryale.AAC.1
MGGKGQGSAPLPLCPSVPLPLCPSAPLSPRYGGEGTRLLNPGKSALHATNPSWLPHLALEPGPTHGGTPRPTPGPCIRPRRQTGTRAQTPRWPFGTPGTRARWAGRLSTCSGVCALRVMVCGLRFTAWVCGLQFAVCVCRLRLGRVGLAVGGLGILAAGSKRN